MIREFYGLLALIIILACSCKQDFQAENQGEIVVRITSEPDKLNALFAAGNVDASRIANQLYPPLLDWDPETLEIVPVLASSRPQIEELTEGDYAGGTKHTYEIRSEAKWDNGSPVTAEDFYLTLKTIVNPKSGLQRLSPFIDFVKKFEVDPEDSKRFSIYSDSRYMLSEMAVGNMPPLPKYVIDPEGNLDGFSLAQLRNPETLASADSSKLILAGTAISSVEFNRDSTKLVGCGAYAFSSWTPGSSIVLSRKKDWWGNDLQDINNMLEASPSKITYLLAKDEPGAITMLKDGQIDAMNSINPTAFKQLQENDLAQERLNMYSPPFLQYYFIGMNMKNPKLEDIMVRRALAHLVDYDAIIENVLNGMGQRIAGPLHPSHYAYDSELSLPDYNPETAVLFLEEAGWRDTNGNGTRDKIVNGQKIELAMSLLASPSENSKNICLLIQSTAAQVGIDIQPVFKELRTILGENIVPRKFDMFALAWSQSLGEYDPKLLWHTESDSGSGRNWVGYGTSESDEVIDKLRFTTSQEDRIPLYHQWQRDVVAAQPYLFLCAPQERIAINKKFDTEVSAKKPGIFENLFELSDVISDQ